MASTTREPAMMEALEARNHGKNGPGDDDHATDWSQKLCCSRPHCSFGILRQSRCYHYQNDKDIEQGYDAHGDEDGSGNGFDRVLDLSGRSCNRREAKKGDENHGSSTPDGQNIRIEFVNHILHLNTAHPSKDKPDQQSDLAQGYNYLETAAFFGTLDIEQGQSNQHCDAGSCFKGRVPEQTPENS